jgi:hypothetical protein
MVLAVVFATMIIGSHYVFRRARLEPGNDEFFDRFAPAELRDFLAHGTVVGFLILSGGWLWFSGSTPWITFSVLAATIAILAVETRNAARFWNQSMGKA